jgi:hypothetical protein
MQDVQGDVVNLKFSCKAADLECGLAQHDFEAALNWQFNWHDLLDGGPGHGGRSSHQEGWGGYGGGPPH